MALFPFLAVLVCTMGSLIVIIAVLARQARVQASQAAAAKAAEATTELDAAREMAKWKNSVLAEAIPKARADLAAMRLRLGSIEDHSRRLRDELAGLEEAAKQLQDLGPRGQSQRRQAESELAGLRARLADAERQLADARRAAANRTKSYAVVPYEGPNATRRRPIYLECRADAIVLQPEGIELVDSDFEGPVGAGNPLERAVRALRQSMLSRGQIQGDGSDEPYPLFLVRPGGIAAYYAGRAALKSWKGEVGYELIGEDWKLAFPKADPALAQSARDAVEQYRAEQRETKALLAAYAGPRTRPVYRVAPRGGLIREGRPEEDLPVAPRAEQPAPSPASRAAAPAGVAAAAAGAARSPAARRLPEGTIPQPRSKRDESAAPPDPDARILRPGEWIPEEKAARSQPPADWPPEGKIPGSKRPDEKKEEPKPTTKSLAETRGRNWGLPNAARGSVGVARPIRVGCHPDRLEILPESGDIPSQIIPLGQRTEDFMDAFVSAVWDHMKDWGIAGRGMYWRPVLRVDVVPGAAARYAEIRTLLDGSGLDFQSRQEPDVRAAAKPQAALIPNP